MSKEITPITVPLIPLRGMVIYPFVQLHFDVERKKSVKAVEQAMAQDRLVCLVAQKDMTIEDPTEDDIYSVGCMARIKQIIHTRNSGLSVIAEGLYRAKIEEIVFGEPYFEAVTLELNDKIYVDFSKSQERALLRYIKDAFLTYAKATGKPFDMMASVSEMKNLSNVADFIAGNVFRDVETRQELLEQVNVIDRIEAICAGLIQETEMFDIEQEIDAKVRGQMDRNQREYYLHEQLKAIYEELDEGDNPQQEAEDYRARIEKLDISDDVRKKLLKETSRLFKMPSASHEATVVRNYIDACLDLPFGKMTVDTIKLDTARKKLDRDHYGLDKVKDRIIELLAVRKMNPDVSGQILCLVGPPGVGKTSIAGSIAKCMGRKFARISLGGVKDEAEIRGHRRTYIGSMPGRIMDAVTRSGSSNPLILMDEIDKLGSDFRGDPAAALLEALDPEQNSTFVDHYLEIPFDLSHVLFVLTANSLETVPRALLDRMEVIELTSYTRQEKMSIAKKHLLPKQLKRHGLTKEQFKLSSGAILGLIDYYTRESGVRNLERCIASLCRKADKLLVAEKTDCVIIKEGDLEGFLGVRKFKDEQKSRKAEVGLVNGLAWTSVGGEIMQLEAGVFDGTGKVQLTGSLGDVMKESAQAAISCIRMRVNSLDVPTQFYKEKDIHIHATEGAIPKDGPSAGVAMTVALVSALTKVPIKHTVAMTGEITLRGRVLAIGGLKEKSMAAYRAGIKTVIVPNANKPDLSELDKVVTDNLDFVCVESIDQVFPVVFANDMYKRPHRSKSDDKNHPPVHQKRTDAQKTV